MPSCIGLPSPVTSAIVSNQLYFLAFLMSHMATDASTSIFIELKELVTRPWCSLFIFIFLYDVTWALDLTQVV